jgi:hypothetical protein
MCFVLTLRAPGVKGVVHHEPVDIERIEILTTPPAQFKSEGAAGVINSITRKKRAQGTSGSMQASIGSGGRYVLGTDGSYNSGPLTLSMTAGYRQERIRREVPAVSLTAGYALGDAQTISASVKWADRGGLRTYTQLNESGAPSGLDTSSSRRLSSGHDPETDYDERLGFSQKLGEPGETLDLSLHRATSRQHEHYDYINDSFIPPSPTFYNNLAFEEDHTITDFGADYVLPVSKTRSLKVGYAFEQDNFKFSNTGNNIDPLTGAQIVDPASTTRQGDPH